MVNKKAVVVSTIILIITVGLIIWISIQKEGKVSYSFNEITVSEMAENKVKVKENKIEENIVEDDKTEENKIGENNQEENQVQQNEVKEKSGEELAKELAKKQWGENDTDVYYFIEEKKTDETYIVSVRSKDTTAGIMDYIVNVNTQEVEEY